MRKAQSLPHPLSALFTKADKTSANVWEKQVAGVSIRISLVKGKVGELIACQIYDLATKKQLAATKYAPSGEDAGMSIYTLIQTHTRKDL